MIEDEMMNGRFYTRGRIIRLDELGQTFVVRLVIRLKSIKTSTRHIMRLDELSFEIRLERRITKGSSPLDA